MTTEQHKKCLDILDKAQNDGAVNEDNNQIWNNDGQNLRSVMWSGLQSNTSFNTCPCSGVKLYQKKFSLFMRATKSVRSPTPIRYASGVYMTSSIPANQRYRERKVCGTSNTSDTRAAR